MITIINKEELFKDVSQAIKNESSLTNNIFSSPWELGRNVFLDIVKLIENNAVIQKLVINEDKDQVKVSFYYDMQRLHYNVKLLIWINQKYEVILNIIIKGRSIAMITDSLKEGSYYICFFIVSEVLGKYKLKFYRNNISKIPESDLIRKRYNRIENIIGKQKYIDNSSVANLNYLTFTSIINDEDIIDNNFVKNLLKNFIFSTDDDVFFENILYFNASDSRNEVIWKYFKRELENFGIYNKENLILFNDYINNIKNKLYPFKFTESYDFGKSVIYLSFKTGLQKPYNDVIIVIQKDDDMETILNKSLRYCKLNKNKDYSKIESICLKDYIENKEEVISMIKLLNY